MRYDLINSDIFPYDTYNTITLYRSLNATVNYTVSIRMYLEKEHEQKRILYDIIKNFKEQISRESLKNLKIIESEDDRPIYTLEYKELNPKFNNDVSWLLNKIKESIMRTDKFVFILAHDDSTNISSPSYKEMTIEEFLLDR